ncbi:MAG: PEGA domain-containing protein [Planctomycetota bacterium]|nr:PEGA domain-containing protein [Planctomycetota bacterium]
MEIRTNPAGASVYVDKKFIGNSPISTSFTYYGTREIEVVRDGFRTEKIFKKMSPPWYQIPPIDFVSEVLWPQEIRDERVVDITMVPQEIPDSEVLQARAEEFRIQSSQGLITANPAVVKADGDILPGGFTPGLAPSSPSDAVTVPPAVNTFPATPQSSAPLGGWAPQRIPEVSGSYRVPPGGN